MESFLFFLKGIAAGFVVAAPVGPVAVLCVRRTIARGPLSGAATGFGAAVADTVYGVIAAYGVSFLANALIANEFWFRTIGGIVLCILAAKTLFASPAEAPARSFNGYAGDFLSALVITGTNPITVIAFGVVFTTIGVATAGTALHLAEALVAGVFIGSMLWWMTLTGIAGLFRSVLGRGGLRWINRVSAAVILLTGILMLVSAAWPDNPVAQRFG